MKYAVFMLFAAILTAKTELNTEYAVEIALKNSNKIKSLKYFIKYKKYQLKSETLYSNPELELEFFDLGGNKDYQGLNSFGFSAKISQELILNSKRERLKKAGLKEVEISEINLKKEAVEIKYEIKKIFILLAVIKKQIEFLKESLNISKEVLNIAKNKNKAGSNSSLDLINAEIKYEAELNEYNSLKRNFKILKNELFSVLGIKNRDEYYLNLDVLKKEKIFSKNKESLDEKLKVLNISLKKSLLDYEKSNRIPNLTVFGAVNAYNNNNSYSFNIGLSIPLPVLNTNKDKIKAVFYELRKEAEELKHFKRNYSNKLKKLRNTYLSLKEEIRNFDKKILPLAQKSLLLAQQGYKEGEFTYLNLLNSQNNFLELEKEYLKKLAKLNFIINEYEYIKGE